MTNVNKQEALDNLNNRMRVCTACRLSATRKHVLVGEGDLNARLMFISLSPGTTEDSENKMFIGPSGKILNKLFQEAEIYRNSVFMTNLIKCMLPKNRQPKMDEIQSCSHFLDEEIAIIHPEVIIPLGFYAARYILNKYQADPPAARVEFARLFGKLIFSNNQKIFPLPHPASLIYNPNFEPETIDKYKKLTVLANNCKWLWICPLKRFYEVGRLESYWSELYCRGLWSTCVRYQMEEKGLYHPDWMLPDGRLDEKLKAYLMNEP
ncbi:uracil-DNA glycosylase [candidate division KSB1 bacterium]|nr:uracil-DNA glycosylase [candidate division KSB1 bacterium]